MSGKKRSERLDWAKFTDLRYRQSRNDLIRLCNGRQHSQLQEIFGTFDDTGLYPIHWAAIHNRSDMIDFMVDNGSEILLRCKNKLFAQGTTLHLAAMNCSIEAASMILRKCEHLDKNQTSFKTLDLPKTSNQDQTTTQVQKTTNMTTAARTNTVAPPAETTNLQDPTNQANQTMALSLLRERDSEGQTALMRSAAPRSKRMDLIRDLLRKNFWSLNGRPAEMALFLIIKGADWRETDSLLGMNLMHLSIVNSYDDIVNLLLVLDPSLMDVPAKLKQGHAASKTTSPSATASSDDSFRSIGLSDSPTPSPISTGVSSSDAATSTSSAKPLFNQQDRLQSLVSTGITPLQLAIVYGRLSVIGLLWRATKIQEQKRETEATTLNDKIQKRTPDMSNDDSSKLRAIMLKALLSNSFELLRFLRSVLLKLLLVFDITVLVIVWMPIYFSSLAASLANGSQPGEQIVSNLASGVFLVSFCVTLLLAFRVMFRDPGYLRRGTNCYFNEISALMNIRSNNLDRSNQSSTNDTRQARSRLDLEERIRLLCHKCKCIRRPRSWHCNYCDRCVQDFDHHCIYLGCCVGRNNRLDFLLMMIALTITSIYGSAIQASTLSRDQWRDFGHIIGFIWISKYTLIGGISSFYILRRACLGVTMFEMIRSNRIRKIFGPSGPSADINKSHSIYSTLRGSFWRYSPDRYLTGDLPVRKILANFREFTNQTSASDYFMSMTCRDSSLARSMMMADETSPPPAPVETRIDMRDK